MNWLRKREAHTAATTPLTVKPVASLPPPQSLDQILDALAKYGNPSLTLMRDGSRNDGWYCRIKMHVSATGASFEIASRFGIETANAAAVECLERVEAAVANLGSKA